MTDELSETVIVMRLAKEVCQRIARKVVRELQQLTNGLQSGDDSGLKNAWDEICVQIQGEESYTWDAYDLTVKQMLCAEVSRLALHEQNSIWLQTKEGEDWICEEEDSRESNPAVLDDIVEYLSSEYVYDMASDWTNPRIRKYLSWD